MSNALGIGPSVMINRLVDRSGTPAAAQLAKVAELRMVLMQAVDNEAAETTDSGKAQAPVVSSGADVDRLV